MDTRQEKLPLVGLSKLSSIVNGPKEIVCPPVGSPTIFPSLPVLNAITQRIALSPPDLSEYLLIAGQHLLDTTGSLLEWMRDVLGLPMSNVYLVGKSYSTSQRVTQKICETLQLNYQPNSQQMMLSGFVESYDYDIIKLWESFLARLEILNKQKKPLKGIFVLDDGGHLLKRMLPDVLNLTRTVNGNVPIVGIEQTSSGIFPSRCFLYPVIEVASAAAKQLEAPMLAELIAKDLKTQIEKYLKMFQSSTVMEFNQLKMGIIGLGNIGKALINHLDGLGYKNLVAFDSDAQKKEQITLGHVELADNLMDFIEKSDIILGCTGTDFMGVHFTECLKILQKPRKIPRVLVSLASKDTEFNTLLLKIHQDNRNGPIDPFKDILYPKDQVQVIILGAGMPFNFLPVKHGVCDYSIPHQNIQLTRGLLAASILQAHNMMVDGCSTIAKQCQLDPLWQRFIVQSWRQCIKESNIEAFEDLTWITEHSGGELCSTDYRNLYFRD